LPDSRGNSIVAAITPNPAIATGFGVIKAIPKPNTIIAVKIGLRTAHVRSPRRRSRHRRTIPFPTAPTESERREQCQ
jgi:hypothetical protein